MIKNCHDQKTIANHFNNFFTTVADKLVQKLPIGKKCFDCSSALLKNCYDKGDRKIFYLKHVSEEFIFKELSHLKSYNLYTVLKNHEPVHVKHGKLIVVP